MSSIEHALEGYRSYFQSSVKEFIRPRKLVSEQLEDDFLREIVEDKLKNVENALSINSSIAKAIRENAISLLKTSGISLQSDYLQKFPFVNAVIRSTIRQLWRDWSNDPDSHAERSSATRHMIETLKASLRSSSSGSRPSILVPGSGLSRLAVELTQNGYEVEANEISIPHLFAVAWVLNEHTKSHPESFSLYPWATQFSNHVKASRQFDSVIVPARDLDECKSSLPTPELVVDNRGDLLLRAGPHFQITTCDFVQGYGPQSLKLSPGLQTSRSMSTESIKSVESLQISPLPLPRKLFDAVATVFFLDTAPNVLNYIRTVHHVLREGGLWLNSGPLLWHAWENGPSGRGEGDCDQDETAKARGVRGAESIDDVIDDVESESEFMSSVESLERPALQFKKEKSGMPSVEISWDDLISLLTRNGFRILESHYGDQAGFVSDVKSMGIYGYRVGFFKAVKESSTYIQA